MNKFHAKKIKVGSEVFDSQKECERWLYLKSLEREGKIRGLRRQVRFELVPRQRKADGTFERPCFYVADFVYEAPQSALGSGVVVEDVKGCKKGAAYSLFVAKRKLMLEKYGIEVREV